MQYSSRTTIRYLVYNGDLKTITFFYTQLHTRLTKFSCATACFVLPFYSPTQSAQRMFVKEKPRVLAFSKSRALMLVAVGLLGSCSIYLCRVYCCVLVNYPFRTYDVCFCSFCLLFSYEMILGRSICIQIY